jgi:hypothetical protein
MSKSPHELWEEAAGDSDRYLMLMRDHGHLVERCPHISIDQDGCDRREGHPGEHTYGHNIFGHRVADTKQVMADLWAEYDRIVRDPERVIAPQAAARKAIVDEVERALIARIARLNRGEDYALAVRIEEARALLDQQGNDTLRLAELPDSQRNIDRETGKRLSYD